MSSGSRNRGSGRTLGWLGSALPSAVQSFRAWVGQRMQALAEERQLTQAMKCGVVRVGRYVPLLLAVVPFVQMAVTVIQYGATFPLGEQWDFILLLDRSYRGELTFRDFWGLNNEHRPLFPRAIMYVLARITRWNIAYELVVNLLLTVGIAFALAYLTKTTLEQSGRRRTNWMIPLTALIVFSPVQWENWVCGLGLYVILNVLATVAGIAFLASPRPKWSQFLLAMLLGVVASYSWANGMVFWLVGFLVLLPQPKSRRARTALWMIAAALTLGSYLYQYEKPGYHPSLLAAVEEPIEFARYVLIYLGAPVAAFSFRHAAYAGLFGLVVFCAALWLLMRRGYRFGALVPYIAIALYALGSGLMTGIGRVGFGSSQAVSSHYMTISSLLWFSTSMLLYLLASTSHLASTSRRRGAVPRWVAGIAVFAIAALVSTSSLSQVRVVRGWREYLQPAYDALKTADVRAGNEDVLVRLHPRVEFIRQMAKIARRHSISPYRDTSTFCSSEGEHCLSLVGHESPGRRFQAGHPIPLTIEFVGQEVPTPLAGLRLLTVHDPWLPWLPSTTIVSDTIRLSDCLLPSSSQGREPAVTAAAPGEVPVARAAYRVTLPIVLKSVSAANWSGLCTCPVALTLPLDAPTGRSSIVLEVLGPDGIPWQTADGGQLLRLFRMTVEGRPVLDRLPRGLIETDVDLGDEIALRGYRVSGDAHPGGELHLTYAWYARTQPSAVYAVMNHLTLADGTIVAQADGWPLEGRLLTTHWQAGEYVVDSYVLAIPAGAGPGPYRLHTGMYDATSGVRLLAVIEGQRLVDRRVPIPLGARPD